MIPNPADYYEEDPTKTAMRKLLIIEGNKIVKQAAKGTKHIDFVQNVMAYLKMK